jgi:hypothetical protein
VPEPSAVASSSSKANLRACGRGLVNGAFCSTEDHSSLRVCAPTAYVDLVFIRKNRGPGRGTYGLRRDRTHPRGDAGHDRKSLGPSAPFHHEPKSPMNLSGNSGL